MRMHILLLLSHSSWQSPIQTALCSCICSFAVQVFQLRSTTMTACCINMSAHCDCLPMLGTAVQQFILIPGFRVHVDHIKLPQIVCIAQDSSPHEVCLHIPDSYSRCIYGSPCAGCSKTWLGADVCTISNSCCFDIVLHCVLVTAR